MSRHNFAILLAGGQGSRFWPLSRTLEPKQFLSLHVNGSLFEQTVLRIRPLIPAENIFIVTSQLYRFQVLEYIAVLKIPVANVIFEPEAKNTSASICAGVQLVYAKDRLARVCVLPCDHLIGKKKWFLSLLQKAFRVCEDSLVVFGIPPTRPATGYGYIKAAREPLHKSRVMVYRVERFTEKPDRKTAQGFLKSGLFFWNSGIFVGSVSVFLNEFKTHLPALYSQLRRIQQAQDIEKAWNRVQAVSFDYGVLEKSRNILMLKAQGLGWSDLGSWQAWDELLKKDSQGNSLGQDVISLKNKNLTVLGKNRLVAAIGLEDIIVIDTPDALLITKKDRSEEVKKVVDVLRRTKRQEHYYHRTVKRPWGSYTVLDMGRGFKIKLVEVKPRSALSLQYHRKRSEHWVVVEGQAKIIKRKKSIYLNANESTFIPLSCTHRITNPKDTWLRIVEVQAGSYLEEDDIVRLKDYFGRS
ncbi:MAG: mannose-1-phosphate guanylyltransferase/mannose-6-phosphate isomerase [Candidatus Omnitrophota bacterium]|nr:MAG: mannose-1-phosphate guanylyltransferase/mannose-6-phosphate isomerase [Candidatus Omnitrophota bacterium]